MIPTMREPAGAAGAARAGAAGGPGRTGILAMVGTVLALGMAWSAADARTYASHDPQVVTARVAIDA